MAQGITDAGCYKIKRIVLLDGTPENEAAVETAYQLTKDERVWVASAAETALVVVVTVETGSTAAFTVEELQESSDGTNFRRVSDVTDTAVGAVGEFRIAVSNIIMAEYVKVLVGTVTLSGAANFTMTIALECAMDSAKYGG